MTSLPSPPNPTSSSLSKLHMTAKDLREPLCGAARELSLSGSVPLSVCRERLQMSSLRALLLFSLLGTKVPFVPLAKASPLEASLEASGVTCSGRQGAAGSGCCYFSGVAVTMARKLNSV